jgi:hypothetical protein
VEFTGPREDGDRPVSQVLHMGHPVDADDLGGSERRERPRDDRVVIEIAITRIMGRG